MVVRVIMMVKAGYVCVTQGGMKAVIWTDVFQTFIMLAGMLAVVIQVRAIHVIKNASVQSPKNYFHNNSVDIII